MALKFANGGRHPLESASRKLDALEHFLIPRSDGEKAGASLVLAGATSLGDLLIATKRQDAQFNTMSIVYIFSFVYMAGAGSAGAVATVWYGAKSLIGRKNKEEKK